MKITIDINDKHINGVIRMLNSFYSLSVNKKYVKEILLKNGQLLGEVIDGSYDDTYPRELFIEKIAKDLVGQDWPVNGDSIEYKSKFYKNFATAAAKKGLEFKVSQ